MGILPTFKTSSKNGQVWRIDRYGKQLAQIGTGSGWEPSTSAYSFGAVTPPKYVFLPVITRNYCAPFFDDFSNPASGWPVGEDVLVRIEYLDGEYRILSKDGNYFYLFRSPSCSRENYVVEVDARWAGTPGDSYGLVFGISGNFSQYYLFYVSADFGDYALVRRDPAGITLLQPFTTSPAVLPGRATNHLKATRNGSQITLEVNGSMLGIWNDGAITGSTGAGVFSSPYLNVPVSDARFDNFSMFNVVSSSLSSQGLKAVTTSRQSFIPVDRSGLPANVDRLPHRHLVPAGRD